MPGPAVHYLISRRFRDVLGRTPAQAADDIAAIDAFPEAFAVGSMGPDFLFFNLRDLDPNVASAVETYLAVADFIREFTEELEALIPPPIMAALEAVEDLASNSVLLSEVQAVVGEMQAVINVLLGSAQSWLVNLADDSLDVFGIFSHPIQDDVDRGDWWWFDTLHYTRTGRFTQTLLQGSTGGSLERAYSLGYLTHYGADIVGHPYVNVLVGGPFRTHGQRHKLVENYQDTWAWDFYRGQEFTRSAMHNQLRLSGTDARMPASLSRFIAGAVERVYGNDFGQLPTQDDLDQAYRLFYRWLSSTTETGLPPEPWSYSLSAELQEAWEQFEENAGSIIDGYNDAVNSAGGPTSIFGLIVALIGLIVAALLLAAALVDFILGTLITIAGAPVREFLAITYQILYSAYLQIRFVTSLKGLAHPLRADLIRPEVIHTLNPQLPDLFGTTAIALQGRAPKLEVSFGNALDLDSHLVYPVFIPDEEISLRAAPSSYYSNLPSHYIRGAVGQDASAIGDLAGVSVADAETPARNAFLQQDRLGNAVMFSRAIWLRNLEGAALPDLSLDGDRGMAWPCNELRHPLTNPVDALDLD